MARWSASDWSHHERDLFRQRSVPISWRWIRSPSLTMPITRLISSTTGTPLIRRSERSAALRGAPYHPMTQGKIERWHQTLKNRILLENYFLPGDLETQIAAFVDDYNHRRYHESIDNLTPADVHFGRGPTMLAERERIKRQTIANRRLQHRLQAA